MLRDKSGGEDDIVPSHTPRTTPAAAPGANPGRVRAAEAVAGRWWGGPRGLMGHVAV